MLLVLLHTEESKVLAHSFIYQAQGMYLRRDSINCSEILKIAFERAKISPNKTNESPHA